MQTTCAFLLLKTDMQIFLIIYKSKMSHPNNLSPIASEGLLQRFECFNSNALDSNFSIMKLM